MNQQPPCDKAWHAFFEPDERLIRNVIESAFRMPEKFSLKASDAESLFDRFKSQFVFVDAAGGIVRNAHGDFLFIIRYGKYDLPKGKLDAGEDFLTAALREVQEETGITDIKPGKFICHTFHVFRVKQQNYLKRTAWFEMTADGNPGGTPQFSECITEVLWVPEKEIPAILPLTYPALSDMIRTYYLKDVPC